MMYPRERLYRQGGRDSERKYNYILSNSRDVVILFRFIHSSSHRNIGHSYFKTLASLFARKGLLCGENGSIQL